MNTTVDPYILQQASCRASLLVANAGFRAGDLEDLRQSLVLDLLRRAPKFDPARGEWQGFVRGVVRNHAAVLVMRERRRAPEILIGDLMLDEEARAGDALDFPGKRYSEGVAALHLSIDIHRVLARLPEKLRSLTRVLGQMPIKDVCERTGKSRSRVYQMTRQIREAFVGAGLAPHSRRVGRSPSRANCPRRDAAHEIDACSGANTRRPVGKDDALAEGYQPDA
jgi:RNA polymerase sigma-70 factor (ECF subfamily)